jgi:hypothetical protein
MTGIRIPKMNAIMERWIRICRTELLDRTLIWNQAHLLHALREYEAHYNSTGLTARFTQQHPCARYRHRSVNSTVLNIRISDDMIDSAASSTNTIRPLDQHGRNFRHAGTVSSTV